MLPYYDDEVIIKIKKLDCEIGLLEKDLFLKKREIGVLNDIVKCGIYEEYGTHNCFLCKKKISSMRYQYQMHHILMSRLDNSRLNEDLKIMLCLDCHQEIHGIYKEYDLQSHKTEEYDKDIKMIDDLHKLRLARKILILIDKKYKEMTNDSSK